MRSHSHPWWRDCAHLGHDGFEACAWVWRCRWCWRELPHERQVESPLHSGWLDHPPMSTTVRVRVNSVVLHFVLPWRRPLWWWFLRALCLRRKSATRVITSIDCRFCRGLSCAPVWYSLRTREVRHVKCWTPEDYLSLP